MIHDISLTITTVCLVVDFVDFDCRRFSVHLTATFYGHAVDTKISLLYTDGRTALGAVEFMTILHVTNYHMVVQDIIEAVENDVPVQTLISNIMVVDTNRITYCTIFRVNVMNTGIDFLILPFRVVVETQHLLLGLTVGRRVNIL